MRWFYLLARSVVWAFFSLAFSIQYEGRENIPQGRGGYILAGNHTSYLDPVVLVFPVRPWVRFLAKGELEKSFWGKRLFSALGIVPIDRGSGDLSAIERCAALTREGHVLGIFPEGTRYSQEAPGKPKSGMALIAKMTGADVLPCAVRYQRPLRFRSRILVRYGRVIPASELDLGEDNPRALRRCTKQVWSEILKLLEVPEDAG